MAKYYAKMGMGADVEYSKLYEKVVTVLRSFQETAYKMLLKHVEGIRLSEFQGRKRVYFWIFLCMSVRPLVSYGRTEK